MVIIHIDEGLTDIVQCNISMIEGCEVIHVYTVSTLQQYEGYEQCMINRYSAVLVQ